MNPRAPGFSTGCFHHQSIFDILEPIRAHGFTEVEISSWRPHLDYHDEAAVRRAADLLRALGLRVASYHAPFGDHIDISSPHEAAREAAIRELFAACRAGATLGAPFIVLHPGPDVSWHMTGAEFHLRLSFAAGSIRRLAELVRPLGQTLLLENMLPHLLFGNPDTLLFLLEQTADAGAGVCLDTGHAHLARALDRLTPALRGRPGLLHLHDNHGDRDAHLVPGQGGIDWARFLKGLDDAAFTGPLMLELTPLPGESIAETLTRATRESAAVFPPRPSRE